MGQQPVKRSEDNLALGKLGFKVSLRKVAMDSADALEGSLPCGTLPSGHPLRVCVKPLGAHVQPTTDSGASGSGSLGISQACQFSPSVVVDETSEAAFPLQPSKATPHSPSGSLVSINLTPAGSPSRYPVAGADDAVGGHLPPGSLCSTHDGKRSAKLSYSQSSVQTVSVENDTLRGADPDTRSPIGVLTARTSPGQSTRCLSSRRSSICGADAIASVEQGFDEGCQTQQLPQVLPLAEAVKLAEQRDRISRPITSLARVFNLE